MKKTIGSANFWNRADALGKEKSWGKKKKVK